MNRRGILMGALLFVAACGRANQGRDAATAEARPQLLIGKASYYSDSLAGKPTASGEPYDPRALTAAHRSLPFGTMVRVRRAQSAREVVVRINDRGPFGDSDRI